MKYLHWRKVHSKYDANKTGIEIEYVGTRCFSKLFFKPERTYFVTIRHLLVVVKTSTYIYMVEKVNVTNTKFKTLKGKLPCATNYPYWRPCSKNWNTDAKNTEVGIRAYYLCQHSGRWQAAAELALSLPKVGTMRFHCYTKLLNTENGHKEIVTGGEGLPFVLAINRNGYQSSISAVQLRKSLLRYCNKHRSSIFQRL